MKKSDKTRQQLLDEIAGTQRADEGIRGNSARHPER